MIVVGNYMFPWLDIKQKKNVNGRTVNYKTT